MLLLLTLLFVDLFPADVNTWLVVFGFHLHNSIPGFPRPNSGMTRVSYELDKSEIWDNLPVGPEIIICIYLFSVTTEESRK